MKLKKRRQSPYRITVAPEGGKVRQVECPTTIQTDNSVRAWAKDWVSDVAPKGTITIEERVQLPAAPWVGWKTVAVGEVVNSVLKGWRT